MDSIQYPQDVLITWGHIENKSNTNAFKMWLSGIWSLFLHKSDVST